MKRKIALLVCMAMLLSMGLYGCKEKEQDKEQEKDILEIESSYAEPNYELQLYRSDDVIYGEVIEELESYYSDPNREIAEIENAWITPYVIKIEKSYKGLFNEGDTVIVCAWNKVGIYPEDEEKYEIVTDQKEFYLQKGQRGVFMLIKSKYLKTDDGQPTYKMVYQDEGVFLPKEMGTANMGEEAKTVYASPSFEITLEQIPADIERADKLYNSETK